MSYPVPQLVSAKTASAKLESKLKQEQANCLDKQKTLIDERTLMSSMEVEHEQRLMELELRHTDKVSIVTATVTLFVTQTFLALSAVIELQRTSSP